MDWLQERLLRELAQSSWIVPGDRVAVACSGGADSTALLLLLHKLAREVGCALSIAHVNHCLRGAESDTDEQFVRELAERLDLPLSVHRVEVAAIAAAADSNREAVARKVRYGFFHSLVQTGAADRVAVAHTADDQAETVLHRLIRGAGPDGLSGIQPVVQGWLIRPLMSFRRGELRQWLSEQGQSWREDSSNQDVALLRNRIRSELLPLLARYNPRVVEALSHTAEIAREDRLFWQEITRPIVARCVRAEDDRIVIVLEALKDLPTALGWRVLRHALQRTIQSHPAAPAGRGMVLVPPGFDFAEVKRLWQFALAGRNGAVLNLSHKIKAVKQFPHLILQGDAGAGGPPGLKEGPARPKGN